MGPNANYLKTLLAAALLAGASQAQAAATYVLCRNQKVVRTIRVVTVKDNKDAPKEESCQVVYSKDGVDKVVGSARWTASCTQVLENVQRNLVQAGWKCRDISTAAEVVEPR